MTLDESAWTQFAARQGGGVRAMSRNVEVLRKMCGRCALVRIDGVSPEEIGVATAAAIETLEALDRQGVINATRAQGERVFCGDTECPTCAMSGGQGGHLAPAEDAKAERIRALTAALEHMQWCRSCAEGSWEQCDDGRIAYRLINPHKSWCRDTEHEGVCIGDPSEDSP